MAQELFDRDGAAIGYAWHPRLEDIIEPERSFIDELEHERGGERFGHAADTKAIARPDGDIVRNVRAPARPIPRTVRAKNHRGGGRRTNGRARSVQRLRELGRRALAGGVGIRGRVRMIALCVSLIARGEGGLTRGARSSQPFWQTLRVKRT